ncbi:MAG: 30S ribosomal protein S1 [Atopobiaceae bacterium]|nr:30S ribosomal protein S1 [Atopobiaceae bacterium]
MSEIQNSSIFSLDDVSDEEMNQLIDGTITAFDEGDLVTGTVVKIEHDEVLLDIGFKSEGVIPSRELSIRKDVDPSEIVALGDEIEALVLQKEDKEGRLILSKKRAEYERAWNRVEEKFNAGENVEGEVIEVVKGGLILDIGLRGFLPASLVDLRRVKDLTAYMGTRIEARVIEMDRNRDNVVLSRRVVLEEARKAERSEILSKLQSGMRLKGTVSSIVDFGSFVDLGGIDGLIHISELSWNHVNHPSEVVKVGQEVEVQVLDVDLNRERISLGLKQTTEDPWRTLVKKYPVGAIVEGQVTKLVTFGAFVDLGDGVEGLVHISEMAKQHVDAPAQVCSVGDTVQVKVMEIDLDRRRISLSMKAAAETLGVEVEVKPMDKPEDEAAVEVEAEVEAPAETEEAPVEE